MSPRNYAVRPWFPTVLGITYGCRGSQGQGPVTVLTAAAKLSIIRHKPVIAAKRSSYVSRGSSTQRDK